MSFRAARTQEDVQRELSAILREMKDPRIAGSLLSIVKIDLASDLSSCRVYVSSLMGGEKSAEAVKALKSASGFIRRELGRRLELRRTPELRFSADSSIERSADIARILNTLEVSDSED